MIHKQSPGRFFYFCLGLSFPLLSLALLAWVFKPLIEFDSASGSVRLLGGTILVSDEAVSTDSAAEVLTSDLYEGSVDWDKHEDQRLQVKFQSGRLEIHSHEFSSLRWSCTMDPSGEVNEAQFSEQSNLLDLSLIQSLDCRIFVPEFLAVSVVGDSGQIVLRQLRSGVNADLTTGQIIVSLADDILYNIKAAVQKGTVSDFPQSLEPNAVQLGLRIHSGQILRVDS
jgi:hypothetical protein